MPVRTPTAEAMRSEPTRPCPSPAGFEQLCRLDARFEAYSKVLFGSGSLATDREAQNAEQNEKLDTALNGFLRLVTGG